MTKLKVWGQPKSISELQLITYIGRPARVEEVAAPIVWLLSNDASFITGACLDVSGGGFRIADVARSDTDQRP